VRSLIVAAARDLFVAQGYEGTSTREIARKAGVIQAAVFRHFGTKEALFAHVALEPLSTFIQDFVDQWEQESLNQASEQEVTRAYVTGLSRLVRENRLLFAMLADAEGAERFEESATAVRAALNRHLEDLESRSRAMAARDGRRPMDLGLAARFTIALVLGTALFEDTLFSDGRPRVSRLRLERELADYVLRAALIGEV
jgi:AcrR family transcriptional regulator